MKILYKIKESKFKPGDFVYFRSQNRTDAYIVYKTRGKEVYLYYDFKLGYKDYYLNIKEHDIVKVNYLQEGFTFNEKDISWAKINGFI